MKIPSWLTWAFLIVSFLGFLDATYLTVIHYSGNELNCAVIEGCNEVKNSKYAEILGIPLALMGSLYYLCVLFLSLLYFDTRKKVLLTLIPPLTAVGFIFSLFLVYLQVFQIQALCIYCLFSALTSTILFVLSLFILKHKRQLERDLAKE